MTPGTQDDFNRQVDQALTRLEASTVACEIVAQIAVDRMWPWQKRALRRAVERHNVPFSSQPHRFEVFKQAKAIIKRWTEEPAP